MKIINLGRGQGKTTRLLYASEFQNIPILCATYHQKGYLEDRAKELGLEIPEPIALDEITSGKIKGKEEKYREIFVDDLHWIFHSLLNHFGMQTSIRAITETRYK